MAGEAVADYDFTCPMTGPTLIPSAFFYFFTFSPTSSCSTSLPLFHEDGRGGNISSTSIPSSGIWNQLLLILLQHLFCCCCFCCYCCCVFSYCFCFASVAAVLILLLLICRCRSGSDRSCCCSGTFCCGCVATFRPLLTTFFQPSVTLSDFSSFTTSVIASVGRR